MTDSADAPTGHRPRKRLHGGEGREALLKAAVRGAARGGLRRLTHRAVAEEAGSPTVRPCTASVPATR
ncbi:hypothetical protein [Streptomyces sp. ID05-04B]|uniref:hypothetical protein n=1 Tax=Streptomyces sp. ID05-04B TaxID=3028661 RepID=UPI0039F65D6D